MRFLLVRHGQTQWNLERRIQGWKDSPVTHDARESLRSLTLPEMNLPVIFSSDLGRARESAGIIAAGHKLQVVCDARLRERKLGLLEGEVIDEDISLGEHWTAYHNRYIRKMETVFGAETEADFESRILSFIADTEQNHKGQDIVIVSHGEWIRAFINIATGTPSWHAGRGIEANGQPVILERSRLKTVNL